MDIDLEAVIAQAKVEVAEMAGKLFIANGRIGALQKHSDKQAEELAELRKAKSEKPIV